MAALIGPDLQQFGLGDAVKAGPVEAVVGMVDFAGQRRHQRNLVGFAMGQGTDTGG